MNAAFVGFGELGGQLHNLVQETLGQPIVITCFDDTLTPDGKTVFPFKNYVDEKFNQHNFFIGLGYKYLEQKNEILNLLQNRGNKLPSIIHSSCYVSAKAIIKAACYLYPLCNIDKGVVIEKGVLLNNSVTISHDCHIGECCYLSPGVILSGGVTIGENTFIGSGAVLSNGIKIGKNVIIGIGSVVTKDVPDNASVIGNPAVVLPAKLNIK